MSEFILYPRQASLISIHAFTVRREKYLPLVALVGSQIKNIDSRCTRWPAPPFHMPLRIILPD